MKRIILKDTVNYLMFLIQQNDEKAIDKANEFNSVGFKEEKENYLIFNDEPISEECSYEI